MKLKISRTSARSGDFSSPCPQAFFEDSFWWVELTTLEELFALNEELDKLLIIGEIADEDIATGSILRDPTTGSILTSRRIEIYDDYRE
jgi:hypothetical protein